MIPALLIYIPTFNRCRSLKLCMERILAEIEGIESDVVIHVSDNHSTDETSHYLDSIQHPCVQWSCNQANMGPALNVTKVHNLSHLADFTFMLGDDDFVLHGALRRLVLAIRANPDIDFFFLNTLSYPEDRFAEVVTELHGRGWKNPPSGATIKSRHETDTRCVISDLFSLTVDEVLGGSLMCYAFRSNKVQNHLSDLIRPSDQGTMYSAYPHTLNWVYSLKPDTPAAYLADPFTFNFWHGGREWGKLGYHRVVSQGLGFVMWEQMRLGYIKPEQFDAYLKHYLNIARHSILMLLREGEKNPDMALATAFKDRLIRLLLGEWP